MSRASQGPASRSRATRSRPLNRAGTGREADRIKATRAGWASPATAVTAFWRSGPLPAPLAGFAAGLWAALTGLAITVLVTLVVWIFAAGESASASAMRAGVDIWLVSHGTPFVVGTGVWSLLPWGWVVFPGVTLYAAGRWVAHRAAVAYPRSAVVAAGCLAGSYALIGLLAALFGTLSGVSAMPSRAALHTAVLAFVVSGIAIAWRARLGLSILPRTWQMVRPALGALATLTLGAGLVLLGALVCGHSATAAMLQQIRPGLVGAAALFVLWLGYLPALLMWCLSFAVGTGVGVAGIAVTPLSPLPGPIETFGLQVLPTTTQPWWLVGTLIPLGAGVVLSRLAGSAAGLRGWLATRAAALAVVLLAVDLWWVISTGRLGSGRLDLIGPPPAVIAVLTAGVALGIALECAAVKAWRRWRRWRTPVVIDLTDRVPEQSGEVDEGADDPEGPPAAAEDQAQRPESDSLPD